MAMPSKMAPQIKDHHGHAEKVEPQIKDDHGNALKSGTNNQGSPWQCRQKCCLRVLGLRVLNLRVLDLKILDLRILGLRILGLRVLALRVLGLRILDLRILGLRTLGQIGVPRATWGTAIIFISSYDKTVHGRRVPQEEGPGLKIAPPRFRTKRRHSKHSKK